MRFRFVFALFVLLLGTCGAARAAVAGNAVDVQLRSDSGRTIPLYPQAARPQTTRLYAETVKGDQYTILVRNLLSRRVGLVIAVDGRNIISGQQS